MLRVAVSVLPTTNLFNYEYVAWHTVHTHAHAHAHTHAVCVCLTQSVFHLQVHKTSKIGVDIYPSNQIKGGNPLQDFGHKEEGRWRTGQLSLMLLSLYQARSLMRGKLVKASIMISAHFPQPLINPGVNNYVLEYLARHNASWLRETTEHCHCRGMSQFITLFWIAILTADPPDCAAGVASGLTCAVASLANMYNLAPSVAAGRGLAARLFLGVNTKGYREELGVVKPYGDLSRFPCAEERSGWCAPAHCNCTVDSSRVLASRFLGLGVHSAVLHGWECSIDAAVSLDVDRDDLCVLPMVSPSVPTCGDDSVCKSDDALLVRGLAGISAWLLRLNAVVLSSAAGGILARPLPLAITVPICEYAHMQQSNTWLLHGMKFPALENTSCIRYYYKFPTPWFSVVSFSFLLRIFRMISYF